MPRKPLTNGQKAAVALAILAPGGVLVALINGWFSSPPTKPEIQKLASLAPIVSPAEREPDDIPTAIPPPDSRPPATLSNRLPTTREAAIYLTSISADPTHLHAAYTRDNKSVFVFPRRVDPGRKFEYKDDYIQTTSKGLQDYDSFLKDPSIIPIGFYYRTKPYRFYFLRWKTVSQ